MTRRVLTIEEKLEAHMKLKPIYPLYGETSLAEHIAWGKAFEAWDLERTRLEMIALGSKAKVLVIWDGALRENGYHENLHRPRGNAADPKKARLAKCEPRDEAHARRLAQQAKYREKKKAEKTRITEGEVA